MFVLRDGLDYVDEDHVVTVFILSQFQGELFERLQVRIEYFLTTVPIIFFLVGNGNGEKNLLLSKKKSAQKRL